MQVFLIIIGNLLGNYLADDFNTIHENIAKYKNLSFVGSDAVVHRDILPEIALDNNIHEKNIGICAYNKYEKGLIESADTIQPIYLRKSQAERMKDKKNG